MESEGDPAAIMDAWSGADRAVLVDTETPLPIAVHLASTHGMGAAEAIELARSLDRLPPRLLVYGIEGTDFHPGRPMSGPVADAVEVARGMVLAEVSDA